jgi:hypothetical protein
VYQPVTEVELKTIAQVPFSATVIVRKDKIHINNHHAVTPKVIKKERQKERYVIKSKKQKKKIKNNNNNNTKNKNKYMNKTKNKSHYK